MINCYYSNWLATFTRLMSPQFSWNFALLFKFLIRHYRSCNRVLLYLCTWNVVYASNFFERREMYANNAIGSATRLWHLKHNTCDIKVIRYLHSSSFLLHYWAAWCLLLRAGLPRSIWLGCREITEYIVQASIQGSILETSKKASNSRPRYFCFLFM